MRFLWLLLAVLVLLLCPGLWRIDVTDSAVVRMNRITGAVTVIPLPTDHTDDEVGDEEEDTCGSPTEDFSDGVGGAGDRNSIPLRLRI